MKIFDSTLKTLERSLDIRLVEQNVLAGNVANADTPGYKPKELDFGAAMQAANADINAQAMAATSPGHMGPNGGSAGTSANDIATSMVVSLAENGLQYGASAKAAGKKLAILRYAIDGGG